MKKMFAFFLALSVSVSLIAQNNIEDGSFENNWQQKPSPSGPYWDYSNNLFITLNVLYEINTSAMNTALTSFRSTNAVDGNYSICMTSKNFGGDIFVPGAFGTFSENFVDEFLNENYIGVKSDFPFKPLALTGYYIYQPVGNDSAAIEMAFYQNNTERSFVKKIYTAATETWTPFTINTNLENVPFAITHLKLLFVASAGYDFNALENCVGNANSNFCIDKVAFSYESGLTEPLMPSVKTTLYPNPSAHIVNFEFNKEVIGKLVIYDVTGAQIAEIPVQDMKTQFTTSELSNGHYFYRLIEGKTILSSGKFAVAK